jgi:hypothetical protein
MAITKDSERTARTLLGEGVGDSSDVNQQCSIDSSGETETDSDDEY